MPSSGWILLGVSVVVLLLDNRRRGFPLLLLLLSLLPAALEQQFCPAERGQGLIEQIQEEES
jgi:hypothetical protein